MAADSHGSDKYRSVLCSDPRKSVVIRVIRVPLLLLLNRLGPPAPPATAGAPATWPRAPRPGSCPIRRPRRPPGGLRRPSPRTPARSAGGTRRGSARSSDGGATAPRRRGPRRRRGRLGDAGEAQLGRGPALAARLAAQPAEVVGHLVPEDDAQPAAERVARASLRNAPRWAATARNTSWRTSAASGPCRSHRRHQRCTSGAYRSTRVAQAAGSFAQAALDQAPRGARRGRLVGPAVGRRSRNVR